MDLRTYTNEMPRGGMAALAAAVGIKPIYLSQLAARQDGREPSPALCVAIEAKTDFKVRRWDLRPKDWHLIWPELRDVDGAPPPVEAEGGSH
jgi:DNA-binding transcriptional regulator YdaS (Cro superfamily)